VQVSPKKQAVPKSVYDKLPNLDEYVQMESDEQKRKALSAISNVAGILPAPSAASKNPDRPSTADVADAAGAAASFNEREDAKTTVALDTELDDLLGELSE
jgi:hypothetical protein